LLNRKSSIFLNRSFSRRNNTCFVGPFGGIGQKYTRSHRYSWYNYIIDNMISMLVYADQRRSNGRFQPRRAL
jgi:hypothetical protein